MSRTVKCGSCGVKQDFAQMNKCLTCSICDSHLGTDWKTPRNAER